MHMVLPCASDNYILISLTIMRGAAHMPQLAKEEGPFVTHSLYDRLPSLDLLWSVDTCTSKAGECMRPGASARLVCHYTNDGAGARAHDVQETVDRDACSNTHQGLTVYHMLTWDVWITVTLLQSISWRA